MRRLALMVGILFGIALMVLLYFGWARRSFLPREIKRDTGAQHVEVLEEVHDADHWLGKVTIDEKTGRDLVGRHGWKRGFEKSRVLANRAVFGWPPDCSACFYSIDIDAHDLEHHANNYRVYVLLPDLTTLEVYEHFGS